MKVVLILGELGWALPLLGQLHLWVH